MAYTTHPTAIIDDGAQIGDDTRVWHWVHISGGARIGERCSFGQNVFVGNDVVIGNNVKVQNNVSIYDAVTLEDDVFCGPSMVFHQRLQPAFRRYPQKRIPPHPHKKGATLGANCTIVCGVTVGEYAFVAAGAVINRDVKPYALMAGVPAKQIGWMSQHGEKLDLPVKGAAEANCPHTGQRYRLQGDVLEFKES
jgi:UDP-2-acetamido-3-amino-2,3-dideoxy-glucuronate N-acetyltransferase